MARGHRRARGGRRRRVRGHPGRADAPARASDRRPRRATTTTTTTAPPAPPAPPARRRARWSPRRRAPSPATPRPNPPRPRHDRAGHVVRLPLGAARDHDRAGMALRPPGPAPQRLDHLGAPERRHAVEHALRHHGRPHDHASPGLRQRRADLRLPRRHRCARRPHAARAVLHADAVPVPGPRLRPLRPRHVGPLRHHHRLGEFRRRRHRDPRADHRRTTTR